MKPGHMFAIYRQSPTVVDSPQGPVYLSDASKYQKLTGAVKEWCCVSDAKKKKSGS